MNKITEYSDLFKIEIIRYHYDNQCIGSHPRRFTMNYVSIPDMGYYDPKDGYFYMIKPESKYFVSKNSGEIDAICPICNNKAYYNTIINGVEMNDIEIEDITAMKQLKQKFVSKKNNTIEIIETTITGNKPNDVLHTVKVNGEIQEQQYNTKQLLNIMK